LKSKSQKQIQEFFPFDSAQGQNDNFSSVATLCTAVALMKMTTLLLWRFEDDKLLYLCDRLEDDNVCAAVAFVTMR
jgi:hypothetical protein